jgi:hypothetical protein
VFRYVDQNDTTDAGFSDAAAASKRSRIISK